MLYLNLFFLLNYMDKMIKNIELKIIKKKKNKIIGNTDIDFLDNKIIKKKNYIFLVIVCFIIILIIGLIIKYV